MTRKWRNLVVWSARTWARVAPAARWLVLAVLLGGAPACATTAAAPPTAPCQAWVAASASWRALDAYVTVQLEQQRAAACYLPPPPSAQPAEPVPPAPAAPVPVPLPGLLPRQE